MNQKEFIKKRLSTYSGIKTYSEFIGWAFNALCNKLKSEGFFIDVNSDHEDLYARLPGSKAIVKFTFDPSMCKWTYIYMGGADEGDRLKKAVESIDLTTPEMKGDIPTELRTYSDNDPLYESAMKFIKGSKEYTPSSIYEYLIKNCNASKDEASDVAHKVFNESLRNVNYSKSLDEVRHAYFEQVKSEMQSPEDFKEFKDFVFNSDINQLFTALSDDMEFNGEFMEDAEKSAKQSILSDLKSLGAMSTHSLDHTPIDLKEVDNFMVTKFPQYQCTSNNYDDSRKYEDGKRVIGISLDRKRKDKFTVTSWYGDDLKGIVEIKGKGINDLETTLTTQAEKLKTYSAWPFILKALGGAVIGQLVAKAFNRAKFKQPSNKELFDATLKKFKGANTPEDAEKYYKMLVDQLNDSENKEEVKQYISEVKEEAESKM